ncbi:kinetochore protein Spc25 [Anastrepha obliqua]|uniref:kinetochore protein Spc25 n=1 Tax=Anastrepha obliqua TaxID=95512 RepID=UPI00240901E0|nr:kinetochore protein Spc25 [Anastrepha obliqua]
MIKYEYAKRIKAMINREIGLERRELALCKLGSKYHEQLEKCEIRYAEQSMEYYRINKKMQELRMNNERINKKVQELRMNNEQLEVRMRNVRARMLEVEASAQRRLTETVTNRLQLINQLDEIHSLKLATNTYINLSALPERIQGVSVQETADSSSWRPFCVEALSHTPEELQHIIWGNSENAAAYSKRWEELVFRSVRELMRNMTKGS